MTPLIAAVLVLVASHTVPSHGAVRGAMTDRLGLRGFRTVHSLVSAAALAAVVVAYRAAEPGLWVWYPVFEARYATIAVMPVAAFLLVGRLTRRPGPEPCGVYRITTTPGSMAVLLWSLSHLAVAGDQRRVILFAGMLAIALVSLVRNAGLANPPGLAGTIPFARILAGRERLEPREIGLWRPVLALLLVAALLALHPLVFGVDPLAGLI
ncbi:hypothetical protein HL658_21850 [Azospirillum sp. RWY-5-1]|uniref:NnrU domain-containing protein n=1 Tax=Azospirillum oleiclasticum TaxID=2735135 RepID=A0ABX2TBG7_9PROT|nr:NnrU family protein [Azospirillum oleiclasticum]NYZ15192.1 hypothetical protein [Azospirillum oleiclasticum]NYZ21387.1 hypothetical protein [Azospirillum oleiclasticum]